ncbi:hypothetical protein [Deferribacter abyssi]
MINGFVETILEAIIDAIKTGFIIGVIFSAPLLWLLFEASKLIK